MIKNKGRVVILSHNDFDSNLRGPTDVMKENLSLLNIKHAVVEHDLKFRKDSVVSTYGQNGVGSTDTRFRRVKGITRILFDILLNIFLWRELLRNDQSVKLICVNPVNALSGVFLKWRYGIEYIYVSADYSEKRFGIFLLDKLYSFIDRFVSRNASVTVSVSRRIQKMRKGLGLLDEKNVFLPNTPPHKELKKYRKSLEEREKYALISVGSLNHGLSYETMFESMKILKKDIPSVSLKIIGGGEREKELRAMVEKMDIADNVRFLGWLEHVEVMEEVSKALIGLAIYSGKLDFNRFGDSMKIREYAGLGLPVITTDVHSTVNDIREFDAGFVIEDDPELLAEKALDLLNEGRIERYVHNAISMSDANAFLHKEFIENLFL